MSELGHERGRQADRVETRERRELIGKEAREQAVPGRHFYGMHMSHS